jgi:hypothetical protein
MWRAIANGKLAVDRQLTEGHDLRCKGHARLIVSGLRIGRHGQHAAVVRALASHAIGLGIHPVRHLRLRLHGRLLIPIISAVLRVQLGTSIGLDCRVVLNRRTSLHAVERTARHEGLRCGVEAWSRIAPRDRMLALWIIGISIDRQLTKCIRNAWSWRTPAVV